MDSNYEYDQGIMSLSDDGYALVADLLNEFNASSNPHLNSAANEPQPTEAGPSSSMPEQSQPRQLSRLVAVEVPTISDSEDYYFIPGHFHVRHLLGELTSPQNDVLYRVKLRSGEKETLSFSQLKTFDNGLIALERFHHSDYRRPTHSRMEGSSGPRLRLRLSLPRSSDNGRSTSEAESESESDRIRRPRRSTRAHNQPRSYYVNKSSDENAESSEEGFSSDDVIVASRPNTRRRQLRQTSSRQLRRSSRRSSRRSTIRLSGSSDDDDYINPRAARHSTRKRKTIRNNLCERFEDDISENQAMTTEKFFGAKEYFQWIPLNDPFRLRHRNACDSCDIPGDDHAKGPLVFCQGCTSAYHQSCLGPRGVREHLVTKVAEDQFILQCRRCVGAAYAKDPVCPHLGCCTVCREQGPMSGPLRERLNARQEQQLRQDNDGKDPMTAIDENRVNNVDNILFRCVTCHRAFHFEHLPPNTDDINILETDIVENLVHLRFNQYSRSWECRDCSSAPGDIDAMVAWRPIDSSTYVSGYTADVMEEIDKEYLIKWKNQSYFYTTWMPGSWVYGVASPHMRQAFFKSPKSSQPHMTAEAAIPEEYLRIDIIFDVRYSDDLQNQTVDGDLSDASEVKKVYAKFKGLPYEEAVWASPPDPSHPERWNDFLAAYQDWISRAYVHVPQQKALKERLALVREQDFESTLVKKNQPETMTGGQMMEYQKDGMNWMYYMWFRQQNAILADEMGLGKTIQVIGLLATLIQDHECWPFLIVVPNSTCPNWRREIKQWAPSIRVVTYYGSSFARKLAHDYEMFAEDGPGLRCHVVVASYDTMIDTASKKVLSRIPWAGLIVDEGQRLKNDKSQLYDSLLRMKFPFKVLLTGTPLQNNTRELLNLIQFCDPTKNAEALEMEFGTLTRENIPKLHDMIRPFFLRRTKAQVLNFLPPIAQIIVPVSMSVLQKKLYKSILAKNPELIKAIFHKTGDTALKRNERHNLNNIFMQLRKCLCHPFVYSRDIEERTTNYTASHRNLVEASGKLQLLELMLPKLRDRGHRVLIFSQFLDNLDLVEDFLDGLGFLHRRLDGRMTSLEKQKQIDAYNADGSPYFAFLLSTRSGGVGINLATADTVIIMDPDFNPHQDMQALSRAHRIGQKNKVLVFQLMTRASAEEKVMQIGKKKMVLDHVLIKQMDSDEVDGQDLESILRHGAQELFNGDDSADIHYDSESVDKLLDRSQAEKEAPGEESEQSQFSFARVWVNDEGTLADRLHDPEKDTASPVSSTVWDKILQERELAAAEEARKKAQTFGRGKRKRTAVDYRTTELADGDDVSPVKPRHGQDSDAEFKADDRASSTESDIPEFNPEDLERPPKQAKVRSFERVEPPAPPPAPGPPSMDGTMEYPHCIACNDYHPVGACRLKLAGVEYCGLCGIAHFGHARVCPHLRDDAQVVRMLDALKHSTEDKDLIERAKKYLRGIRGDLAQRKRLEAIKANPGVPTPPRRRGRPSLKPVVELTRR